MPAGVVESGPKIRRQRAGRVAVADCVVVGESALAKQRVSWRVASVASTVVSGSFS